MSRMRHVRGISPITSGAFISEKKRIGQKTERKSKKNIGMDQGTGWGDAGVKAAGDSRPGKYGAEAMGQRGGKGKRVRGGRSVSMAP
jgi:hypothetical protein